MTPSRLLLATVVAIASAQAAATDFGGRTPEVDELVEALQPPERTRGIAIVGASSAVARPSASMQVGFEFDSSKVMERDLPKIERLAAALRSSNLSAYRYQVIGHTDATGAVAYNMRLSQQRAASVVQLLQQMGVAPQRLRAEGRGPRELLNPQQPDAAENRRVEVRLSP